MYKNSCHMGIVSISECCMESKISCL